MTVNVKPDTATDQIDRYVLFPSQELPTLFLRTKTDQSEGFRRRRSLRSIGSRHSQPRSGSNVEWPFINAGTTTTDYRTRSEKCSTTGLSKVHHAILKMMKRMSTICEEGEDVVWAD
jgi:hypothetical protein